MVPNPRLLPRAESRRTCLRTLLLLLLAALVSLLGNGELDTAPLGKRDPCLGSLANDKDVAETSGKLAALDIPDVDNVKATNVLLAVDDRARSAHVATARDHDEVSDLKLDKAVNLVCRLDCGRVGCASSGGGNGRGGEEEFDRVVDADGRVRVSDGSAIVGDEVGNALGAELDTLDLAELVCQGEDACQSPVKRQKAARVYSHFDSSSVIRWTANRPLTS